MLPPELLTESLVPRGECTSIGDPGMLNHWLAVRSCEGSGAGYTWSYLKHLECCSGFFRKENTTAKASVGPVHNLALEEIPTVLLVDHFFRAGRKA